MTDFAGESYRLKASDVKDFDGTLLVPLNLTSATAEIFDFDYSTVLAGPSALTYGGSSTWYYVWNTAGVPAGVYWGRLKFVTTSGVIGFEDECITLHADPSV